MFSRRTGSRGEFAKERTGSGTPAPVASTGMSSYLSKLIPVCCLDGSLGSPKRSFSSRILRPPTICFPSRQAPKPNMDSPRGAGSRLREDQLGEDGAEAQLPPPPPRELLKIEAPPLLSDDKAFLPES